MTWSHRVWEQTPLRWCLKLLNWYMCVCQKSIGTSVGVVLSQVFPVTHFTSCYHTFLKWMPWILQGGQHPYPRFVTRPGFQSRRSWHQRMPEEKPLSDMGSGYGHFWCGWVFRCYTTVTTMLPPFIWACKFVKQRIGLGKVKLIFRSDFRVYWHNQRLM